MSSCDTLDLMNQNEQTSKTTLLFDIYCCLMKCNTALSFWRHFLHEQYHPLLALPLVLGSNNTLIGSGCQKLSDRPSDTASNTFRFTLQNPHILQTSLVSVVSYPKRTPQTRRTGSVFSGSRLLFPLFVMVGIRLVSLIVLALWVRGQ